MPPSPDDLKPLVRPGRTLRFRGRSSLEQSSTTQWTPRVGYLLSSLRLRDVPARGPLILEDESYLYGAEGKLMAAMSSPLERRTQIIQVDRPSFRASIETRRSAPRRGTGYGKDVKISFSYDGFGLNGPARRAALLFTLALPAAMLHELKAGREVQKDLDFFMVRRDPLADRRVVEAAGAKPAVPEAAEKRVRGRTRLTALGVEPYGVDWRFPPPPEPADAAAPPEEGRPDQRIELAALRIQLDSRLELERLFHAPGAPPTVRRHDRLTLWVLDDEEEPWILGWEGIVRTDWDEDGLPAWKESFASRRLYRIEIPPLDVPQTRP